MNDVPRYHISDSLGTCSCRMIDVIDGEFVRHTAYVALEAKYDEAVKALEKIEKQRARWRASKSNSRHKEANPARYNPAQTSIYGEGHAAELTS